MTRRRRTLWTAAAVLVLAACSSDAADDDAAAPSPPSSAAAPTTTAAPVASPPPTTAPPTAAPSATASTVTPPTTAASAIATTTPTSGPGRDFSGVAPIMSAFVERHQLDGAGLVVVDRDDGIVHEEYVGEFDRDRVSLIASSSKMITAGVLLRLADDGLLDLDAPLADAVDWGASNPDITPAQLISNSSGLDGLFSALNTSTYVCQFRPADEIEACAAEVFATDADDAQTIAPDTEFRYGGVQWQVAGGLAEAVSGTPWAQLIDEIYVQPCGVDSLGYNNHWAAAGGFTYPSDLDPSAQTPTENPNMEGGAYITPPDYAELLLMHLRDGMCDGGRVLSEAAVERAHADRVAAVYPDGGSDHPGYGLGWWVDRDTGIISDGGAYGSLPWLDLDDGYGAYLVLEANSGLGSELFGELEPVVDAAMNG